MGVCAPGFEGLMLILSSSDMALKIITSKNKEPLRTHLTSNDTRITPDPTPMQREFFNNLKKELKNQKLNGEDVIIKYQNGTPRIVPSLVSKNY